MSRTPPSSPGSPIQPARPTHYQLLLLNASASSQELRTAFRTLSKRYHPDTTTLPAAQAELAFQRLQQAYAVLSDPALRRAYDAQLLLAPPPAPAPALAPLPVQRPASVRRALSGGEWFALLLLAAALVFSLVLGVGLAWARGAELVRTPSWWSEPPAGAPTVTTTGTTTVAPLPTVSIPQGSSLHPVP
jgi:hypothetical protein